MTTELLVKLFEKHGVATVVEGEWVLPNAKLPALRALWDPGESSGRLVVHILLEDKRWIEESFAGLGQGDAALQDAMLNFVINSFHVLLAALWNLNDPEQVTTETWSVCGKPYTAFIGNFGTRGSERATPHIPEDLFARLEKAIQQDHSSAQIHWYRFFFANLNHNPTIEALKDNGSWASGVTCLKEANWVMKDGYYSTRLFLILRAA